LRFKSLGTFNLAMLGKQGWSIMTNPQTLIAKMYKARYLPHSNFFKLPWGINQVFSGDVFVMLSSSLEREADGR